MYTLICFIVASVNIYLLIRLLKNVPYIQTIAKTNLAEQEFTFTIKNMDKYIIWNKRKNNISVERRGNYKIYQYELTHQTTNQPISLQKEISHLELNKHQRKNIIEQEYIELYSFQAQPGTYTLKITKYNPEILEDTIFSKFWNPFRIIDESKYEIVISPYISFSKKLKYNFQIFLFGWFGIISLVIGMYCFHHQL